MFCTEVSLRAGVVVLSGHLVDGCGGDAGGPSKVVRLGVSNVIRLGPSNVMRLGPFNVDHLGPCAVGWLLSARTGG